jgi:hypothetical protein
MRYLASFIVTLAWSLWFGGMIALLLFVTVLFKANRPVAVEAAPVMFVAFGRAQLLLGACALVGAFAWWVLTRRRAVMALFMLFAISAAGAAASLALVVAPMERLRAEGQSESPQFKRLHGVSSAIYLGEAILLLAAGAVLPGAMRSITPTTEPASAPAPAETAPGTAPA